MSSSGTRHPATWQHLTRLRTRFLRIIAHIENDSDPRHNRPECRSHLAVPKFLGEPRLRAVVEVFIMKSFSLPECQVRSAVKSLGALANRSALAMVQECNRQEIERAVDNIKRSARDKWFQWQWYKTEARERWNKQRRFCIIDIFVASQASIDTLP